MPSPRVAVAQIRPRKGDYRANLTKIGGVLAKVASLERSPDLVVFPETATSGYFLEGGVRELAVPAPTLAADVGALHVAAGGRPVDVVIGFYEEYETHYHNSAAYLHLTGDSTAEIRHIHRKVFLPTYGVFDERRFVQSGQEIRAFDTPWGRMAMLICEDAWHSLCPTLAALDGADFLLVPTASPARGLAAARVTPSVQGDERLPASLERWEVLGRNIASEHGMYVIMSQLVGFEGGKAFPGVSMIIAPGGELRTRGPLFDEAVLVADCPRDDVTRARTDMPLLNDLEIQLPGLLQASSGTRAPARPIPIVVERSEPPPEPCDVNIVEGMSHSGSDELSLIDPELVTTWLTAFIREEVTSRRGFAKGLVGLSGGVDSAVTAYLAARALGAANLIGVRMPYEDSSPESLAHAALVGDALGIELQTVDITAAVRGYAAAAPSPPDPMRLGNVMARVRMITLFDLSAAVRALPLGTGNKTERLLGYFTWHADDSPPVNPIGDLFKTQVWELARYLGVPPEIVDKPATADLIRGQTDEGDLGISYPLADRVLHALLSGVRREDLTGQGIAASDVELVWSRLSSTHWKRRPPTSAMVSETAIGEYYLRPVDY